MENGLPEYVDREELSQILTQQSAILPAQEARWWRDHRVEPFAARFEDRWHWRQGFIKGLG